MKLETRTFDLYAKVLAIAFATVIRLCAPFRCQPCFHMSNSLIGLLLEVYIPSCNFPKREQNRQNAPDFDYFLKTDDWKHTCEWIKIERTDRSKTSNGNQHSSTVLLLCLAVSTPSFFSNMEIVHWMETKIPSCSMPPQLVLAGQMLVLGWVCVLQKMQKLKNTKSDKFKC